MKNQIFEALFMDLFLSFIHAFSDFNAEYVYYIET